MRAGFIGTGNMGSVLISSLIRSGALHVKDITVSNRTLNKAKLLANRFPGLFVAEKNIETVERSDWLFLCIKPLDFKSVIDEIRPAVRKDHVIISITSPVLIEHLEQQLSCKIAKIIPSITNYELSGACLYMCGNRMEENDRRTLTAMLEHISTPVPIDESLTRISSDLSSCGPAFLSFFAQQFMKAAIEKTGITNYEAQLLVSEMILGTGKLLTNGGYTPETLQHSVAVPGGITAEGLRLLQTRLDGVFEELIDITHAKYDDDLKKVNKQFNLDDNVD